ncbi:TraB/GumN family protein [Methanobacterium sp.]|uniref:TraB/GumN family protein n=1 Tax=Methanobacterium sp. TaxID=2164 RepID=UPI003C790D25
MAPESLEIIGTAHVSEKSVEKVRNTILEKKPDVVAIELDINRYTNLLNEKEGVETPKQEFQIKKLIKGDNLTLFLVSGFLSYMQRRIGDDVGVKPGSEMMAAIEAANEIGAKIALIDRDISITLNRALNKMSIIEKAKFVYGLIASFFSKDEEIEDIESITEGDALEEVMEYFKEMSPKAYDVLVNERDKYMARMLIDIPDENVVAVVGAGHKEGITKYIHNPEEIPPLYDLLGVKKSRFSIMQILLFLIPVVFIAVFAMAFLSGINIQTSILQYVLLTSGLSFAGCILSGSKIYSAITAFVVAPLTVLHPLLAAGWFSGLVEAKSRKVGVADLAGFKDCESLRDFWDNNLFRVLIVVVGTNIGATIGAFLTIPNVFYPLILKISAVINPIIITIFNIFNPILGKIFGWG